MKISGIKQLIENNQLDELVARLYKYYPKVKALVEKNGGCEDDAKDIFQDALLLFIDKLKSPDFTLTCKPETFLYSVCHNLWRVAQRDALKKTNLVGERIPDLSKDDLEAFMINESRHSKMDQILHTIGDKCKQVLGMYYLQKKSMKEIAKHFGFSSEQVAKNQKYKCLERAKKMAKESQVQSNSMVL